MGRPVLTHVSAAAATLLLAALVVAIGAFASPPSIVYFALVALGVSMTVGGVVVSAVEWTVVFALFPPWVLAVLLPPSAALALGFLAGGVGGVLAVPLVVRVGETVERVAG